jgi:hypothetical protein
MSSAVAALAILFTCHSFSLLFNSINFVKWDLVHLTYYFANGCCGFCFTWQVARFEREYDTFCVYQYSRLKLPPNIGKYNQTQTRRSLKIEYFIFSAHTGLTHALSTALGETTWTGETAKRAQQHH